MSKDLSIRQFESVLKHLSESALNWMDRQPTVNEDKMKSAKAKLTEAMNLAIEAANEKDSEDEAG
ncbi:hypothetical protein [Vibrio sp. H11]|uniref:hypothetical protein n=1 Tax=Vibrio sp. H11 TaxID=2565928 RepID=UPI0010A66441|nr:hypothetical protein [Vibrio sp. H11]